MMKWYFRLRRKAISYFAKHVEFNAVVHVFGGIALGILITAPLINPHPVRWALIFAAISIGGHLYALTGKK